MDNIFYPARSSAANSMAAAREVQIAELIKKKQNSRGADCRFRSCRHYIRIGWTLLFETVIVANQQQSRAESAPSAYFFISFSPHLSGMMTVSHNASQREPGRSCVAGGKACAITGGPPAVSAAAVEGLERGRAVSF